MTAARMQEFTPNPDTDTCEPEEYTSIMVQTLLAQILAIRVPPLKVLTTVLVYCKYECMGTIKSLL